MKTFNEVALVYEMPFGLVFREAVLWHDGKEHEFRNLQEIKEIPMNSGGISIARRKMDSDWKQRSMALGRASIVFPT